MHRIIGQREALKLKNDALERELADLKKPTTPPAPPAPGPTPPAKPDGLTAEQRLEKLEREQGQRTLADKRKAIADAVLTRVPEAHKEAVRAMVRLLEEEPGGIDLASEDTHAQGQKALDSLSKRHPAYFIETDAKGLPIGTLAGGKVDFSNLTWDQLPPDVQRSMSDEDFAKHFGPNAVKKTTSILGGGYTNRR